MITAYLVGISTYQENEDIEIRYSIFEDDQLICKNTEWRGYKKPSVVTHVALMALLKKLKKYSDQEITILINDGALYEQIRGTSATKKQEVLKTAKKVKEQLERFGGNVTIKNVGTDKEASKKWNKVLDA